VAGGIHHGKSEVFLTTKPAEAYRLQGIASQIKANSKIVAGTANFLCEPYQALYRRQRDVSVGITAGSGGISAGISDFCSLSIRTLCLNYSLAAGFYQAVI
jgi:hypothetical protein